MSFLDELKARWVAAGVGTASTILIGRKAKVPPGDGPIMVLVETGGTGPSRVQNPGKSLDRPTAQVSVRATSQPVAEAMLMLAYTNIGGPDGAWNVDLGSVRYLKLAARQRLIELGLDEDERPIVAFNLDAEKQPS